LHDYSVIIIAGKNYFPADIEHFMDGYEGITKSMAFSLPPDIETNRYSLVYLIEVKEGFADNKSDAEKAGASPQSTIWNLDLSLVISLL